MAQTLNIRNFGSLNLLQATQLSANIAASSNSLPVINAAGFTTDYLLIGVIGSDVAELLPNTSTNSGLSIPLSNPTILPHNQGDPICALFGNQLNIYRALDAGQGLQPPDSSFVLLDTIDIDPNSASTLYSDPSGGGNYWYKFTYYNENSSAETSLGSAVAVRGNFTVNYCSIDEIRREAGFQFANYITEDQIDEKRQAAQDEINGALDDFYQTPLQPPINSWLKNICIRLSAGLLRLAQYSSISDPQVNGQNMYDAAQLDLDKLIMKERVLVNKQGQALDGPGATGGIEGMPNSSTATAPKSQGGAPRVFRMGDIQGQPMATDSSGNPQGNAYYGRKW